MTRKRLVGLSLLSIENDIAQALDFSALLKTFANAKALKMDFLLITIYHNVYWLYYIFI
jgi:hypothetical protein